MSDDEQPSKENEQAREPKKTAPVTKKKKKKKKKQKKGSGGKKGAQAKKEEEKKGFGSWAYLLLVPLLVVAWLAVQPDKGYDQEREDAPALDDTRRTPLTEADMPVLAETVASLWRRETVDASALPKRFGEGSLGVYVAVRTEGQRSYHTWRFDGTVLDSLRDALQNAEENRQRKDQDIDTIEVVLAHSFRALKWGPDRKKIVSNIHRGVRGLEMRYKDERKVYSPTYFLASNRKPEKQIGIVAKEWGLAEGELDAVQFRTFEAEQALVNLAADPPTATLMERGNAYVPASAVTQESTRELVDLQARWLVDAVHPDGRMTYLYWPSAGGESPPGKNNMIRQWMATVALGRLAAYREDQGLWDLAEKNIEYNLEKFYHLEGELGMIEWNKKVKLGALALAAYAISNHPKREKWAEQERAMQKTIDTLWNESGRFDTFYKKLPSTREQQNFYPGEALFYWADLYAKERDPALLERFMKSYEYYKGWHLDPQNRNPALIPWHTEAYYQVWTITKEDRLADFIFEMNDWLVKMQQWDDIVYRDTKGRFFSTGKWYGPPHASATGVYMEGLVDALELARAVGDVERAEAYRLALARGLRSIMQLQFVDDLDMFYISKKDPVVGGLRTTVYDNAVRCDNVQHSMMANIKILEKLAPEDYLIQE